MSFSYEDPSDNDISAVRFEVGDTRESGYILEDEDIQYALNKDGSVLKAAARMADRLAAHFTRKGETRTANISLNKISVPDHYRKLAKSLRNRAVTAGDFIHLTQDKGAITTLKSNTNIRQPEFKVGIHDNQQSGTSRDPNSLT